MQEGVLVQIGSGEQFEAKVFGMATFVSGPSKCLAKQRRRTEFLSAPEPSRCAVNCSRPVSPPFQ